MESKKEPAAMHIQVVQRLQPSETRSPLGDPTF
jgi:hypothetical protein